MMRQGFDPNADCPRQILRSSQPRWAAGAAQLIVGLALAYETLKDKGGDVTDLLESIADTLSEIQDELQDINRNLERILDYLYELPAIVRGEVERALMRQSLAEAKGVVGLIRDNSTKEKLANEQSRVKVDALLDNLAIRIEGISGCNGMTGAIAVAPYFQTWILGRVGLEKWYRENMPSQPLDSPWTKSLVGSMSSVYTDLFTRIEEQDRIYETEVIPSFPPHHRTLMVKEGKLRLHPRPVGGDPMPPPTTPQYQMICPRDGSKERLELNIAPWPDRPIWKLVTTTNAPDAKNAYDVLTAQRNEVTLFYDAVPEINSMKQRILQIFTEPAGYWDKA